MKKNIDQFFSDNLQERNYEFNDSYWEAAEAMIAAQEQKRRRGILFWWLCGFVFPVALLGSIYIFSSENQSFSVNEIGITKTDSFKQLANKASNNSENDEIEAEIKKPKNENENEKNRNIGVDKVESGIVEAQIIENSNSNFNQRNDPTVNETKQPVLPNFGNEKRNENENENENLNSKTEQRTEKPKRPIAINQNEKPETSGDEFFNLKDAEKGVPRTKIVIPYPAPVTSKLLSFSWTKPKPKSKTQKELEKEYKLVNHKWQLGLTGALGFYKFQRQNDFQRKDWSAGAMIGYKFSPFIGLAAEISYKKLNGIFLPSSFIIQSTQSFGQDSDRYSLNPESLHFLQVPIYGQYFWRKHTFEAGFATNFLLGAKGNLVYENQLFPWERSDDENAEYLNQIQEIQNQEPGNRESIEPFRTSSIEKSGWLETDGIRKVNAFAIFGYRVKIWEKFDLGIRGQYRFLNYYQNDQATENQENKWSFQISGTYYLKN